MTETKLAQRAPLAHCVVAGAHGSDRGEPGVTLAVRDDMLLYGLLGSRSQLGALRNTAGQLGFSLPEQGRFVTRGPCHLLWTGPDQWLIAADPGDRADVERLLTACRPHGLVVDQSDGRALLTVSGSRARNALAKGIPCDLHPRVFKPGMTMLTTAAAVALQLWQIDEQPTYMLALPRSFAEGFWSWLTHAAAEYGARVER